MPQTPYFMTPRRRAARAAFSLFLSLAPLAGAVPASAAVEQLDGTRLPTPVKDNELGLVRSRGFEDDAVTLEGLFMHRDEDIDPVADASTEPGVFSPLCGFSGELVLRGGGCKVAFGWYNATASGVRPPDNQIYELIPADTSTAFDCDDDDFCPLATMETTQTGQHGWTPRQFSAADIRNDRRYQGGLVGFALIGKAGTYCTQTKFSQRELNTVCTSCTPNEPWVTTLIYTSTAEPDAFYVAFEDLPVTATSWKGNQGGYENDGDFNDFVYYITGVTCKGGGEVCDTGLQGACAVGRTGCATEGEVQCLPVLEPGEQKETCDNIDNDCDGKVDNGEGLCNEGFVCNRGSCVPYCGRGEVVCDLGLVCNDDGFCVEPACVDKECTGGQICVGGNCVGGCDGVVCPANQECQLGRCVDLCAHIECEDGAVCERGICQSNCGCRTCPTGKVCGEDGRCVDTGCDGKTCADGQVCVAGSCVDACAGAVCPGNAPCVNGACGEPVVHGGAASAASGGPIGPDVGLDDPVDLTTGSGSGSGSGSGGASGGGTGGNKPDTSCACRAGATSEASPARVGLLGLGLLLLAGRRRRARRAASRA
ncbi:hypothetical protein [Sorangium cellulosum]|nr:hypothetical protein [Sorangium cellulosum]